MQVVRVVIYRGDTEWVNATLEKSLLPGTHQIGKGRTITVFPASVHLELVSEELRQIKHRYEEHFRETDQTYDDPL